MPLNKETKPNQSIYLFICLHIYFIGDHDVSIRIHIFLQKYLLRNIYIYIYICFTVMKKSLKSIFCFCSITVFDGWSLIITFSFFKIFVRCVEHLLLLSLDALAWLWSWKTVGMISLRWPVSVISSPSSCSIWWLLVQRQLIWKKQQKNFH